VIRRRSFGPQRAITGEQFRAVAAQPQHSGCNQYFHRTVGADEPALIEPV
jgi:hypothetical protein